MKRSFLSAVLFALGTVWAISLAKGADPTNGVVEYSFDPNVRLMRTTEFIYLINPEGLSITDNMQFERIGGRVSIELAPGAVTSAWSIYPAPDRRHENALISPPDSIAADKGMLVMTGTVLPATIENERFLLVGRHIFHLKVGDRHVLRDDSGIMVQGRTSLRVPAGSVDSAWALMPPESSSRAPASLPTLAEPDHFEISGRWLTVSGVNHYSVDDQAIQIQSGDTFFAIARSTLTKAQKLEVQEPGRHVDLHVPLTSLKMIWSQ